MSREEGTCMIEETKEKDEVQFDEQHLRQLLENSETDNFREEFLALHPYDQAQFYEKVDQTYDRLSISISPLKRWLTFLKLLNSMMTNIKAF